MSKPGITKSQGYLNRVFCVEYDLRGMIEAFGVEFMHTLVDAVSIGEITSAKDFKDFWALNVDKLNTLDFDDLVDHNDDNELLTDVA